MNQLISVIIPTFNRERYIQDAITSVLNQKLPKGFITEVIVIDDGSTDNTFNVVKQFHDKLIYKKIQNSGRPAVARNIGIKIAKGSLLAFQDSDDIWLEDKLIMQLPSFANKQVDLSYGNAEIINQNGKLSGKTVISPDTGKSGSVFESLLESNFISTLTVIAKKAAILRLGGFNESIKLRGVEDYDLWLKMAANSQFKFVNKTLAYYRSHSQNISTRDQVTSLNQLIEVYREVLREGSLTSNYKNLTRDRLIILLTERLKYDGANHKALKLNRDYHKLMRILDKK